MDKGTVSRPAAKTVFEQMFQTGQSPMRLRPNSALPRSVMPPAIEAAVRDVIASNRQAVVDSRQAKSRR